jgi:hypothetical protein
MCPYKNGGATRRTVENKLDIDHVHLFAILPSDDERMLHHLIGKLTSYLPEQL